MNFALLDAAFKDVQTGCWTHGGKTACFLAVIHMANFCQGKAVYAELAYVPLECRISSPGLYQWDGNHYSHEILALC